MIDPFHFPFALALGYTLGYAFWGALCAVGDVWEWARRRGL